MTTIAYKDGIVAADSMCSVGTRRVQDENKIVVLNDGSVLTVAGKRCEEKRFVKWLNKETKTKPKAEGATIIHFTTSKITVYHEDGEDDYNVKDAHAWGSGEEYALGAMAMGATAKDAVKVAKSFDVYTGGKVNAIKVEKERK